MANNSQFMEVNQQSLVVSKNLRKTELVMRTVLVGMYASLLVPGLNLLMFFIGAILCATIFQLIPIGVFLAFYCVIGFILNLRYANKSWWSKLGLAMYFLIFCILLLGIPEVFYYSKCEM